MKIELTWEDKLRFRASDGRHEIVMDTKAPLSSDEALSPKQLLLSSMAGCAAMDVVSLLKKQKQELEQLIVLIEAPVREQYPTIFTSAHYKFVVKGPIAAEVLKEAVELSLSKYCSVSAMVSKVVPISYEIDLAGNVIARGQANFSLS